MIRYNQRSCPKCGGTLSYYDSVKRIIRTKRRITKYIHIRRLRCNNCRTIHRELKACLLPYKQYEAELIFGFLEGLINSDTLGYENYPCETTMFRWQTRIRLSES